MFSTVAELAGFTALLLTVMDLAHGRPLLDWAARWDLLTIAAILVAFFAWQYGPDSFPISRYFP